MKKSIRVALSFATFSDDLLNSFSILVITCLKTNPLFPTPPVTIADLTALQTTFQDAITTAEQGGPMDTAAKNEARDALVAGLRQIAGYVQTMAVTLTLSQILSSGYDVAASNHTQSPLAQPVLIALDNSVSGQLGVSLQPVTHARAYQVQFMTSGAAAWQEAGIFPSTRGIVIPNLTPGTVYTVRVRAVGGSTQYSNWSATIALMAT
ncbi:MAG TPA: fibronectin type III domain-containing protein [Verrucomicrobiae bacterium]|nr:fibronectin type III domain-containing protein [Verrucomicrobiae bacterium]